MERICPQSEKEKGDPQRSTNSVASTNWIRLTECRYECPKKPLIGTGRTNGPAPTSPRQKALPEVLLSAKRISAPPPEKQGPRNPPIPRPHMRPRLGVAYSGFVSGPFGAIHRKLSLATVWVRPLPSDQPEMEKDYVWQNFKYRHRHTVYRQQCRRRTSHNPIGGRCVHDSHGADR